MESFLLDTSALVKYYHPETGSQWLLNLVKREQPHLLVSNLTVVEMHSALAKKHAPTRALRTLDALQLAVAMDLKEHGRLGTFVVADETLADVATQEGITAVNPETMGQTEVR